MNKNIILIKSDMQLKLTCAEAMFRHLRDCAFPNFGDPYSIFQTIKMRFALTSMNSNLTAKAPLLFSLLLPGRQHAAKYFYPAVLDWNEPPRQN